MQDTHPDYSSDDEDLDYSPFSSVRAPPDLLFNSDSVHGEPTNPPIQIARTRSLRERLTPGTAHQKVLDVLNYLDTIGLNLLIFLDLLSWGNQACIENRKINYERTSLMVSEELPSILARWHKPPRSPRSTSARAEGASHVVEQFAFDCVTSVIGSELQGVSETMRCSAEELSTEGLTGLQIEDLILKLSSPGFGGTPKFWSLLRRLTHTKRQQDRHMQKDADLVCTITDV